MIGMLTRHKIQVLREAGHSLTDVAALSGVSEHTVRRVSKESPVTHADDCAARTARHLGRPSAVEPFRHTIQDLLAEKPPLMSLEILRRVRLAGYTGGKTALYEFVRSLRPEKVRPLIRFEGLPGEFTQHDFGHVDVRFIHAPISRIHFFASRLKYSRWVQVSLVPDERVETLVRSMVDHFASMGGIPLLAVFDRPKTVVISWAKDGAVTQWNSTFAGVMLDLGLGVDLCWPHSPQQKGSVENLVGWVKGSFFKQRRFLDDEDLHSQLAAWLVEVNTLRPSRATGVIPAARMDDERARLRPLKVPPNELALVKSRFVCKRERALHRDLRPLPGWQQG